MMTNPNSIPPGFTAADEILGLTPQFVQPTTPPQVALEQQIQQPQQALQPVQGTEYVTRRRVPGWIKGVGILALGAAAAYGVNQYILPEHSPQAQSSTDHARQPSLKFTNDALFGQSASPTPDTSSASASAPAAPDANFKASPVDCVKIPVAVSGKTPIHWYSTLSDGSVFQTKGQSYPGLVNGTAVVSACWNNTRSMSYDQAASDKSGTATYTIPSESVYYTLDERQVDNTVQSYEDSAIFQSLRKKFHQRAHRFDAKRLSDLIVANTDIPHTTNDISGIDDFKLRHHLAMGTPLKTFTSEGQAALEASIVAQAAQKGYTIDVAFTGATPKTSLPFIRGLKKPGNKGDQYLVRPNRGQMNITVGQVTPGGGA